MGGDNVVNKPLNYCSNKLCVHNKNGSCLVKKRTLSSIALCLLFKRRTKNKRAVNACSRRDCKHNKNNRCLIMSETQRKNIYKCNLYSRKTKSRKIANCKDCVFFEEKREKCTILTTTNGINCSFFKTKEEQNNVNETLKKRLRKIYEQPNGKAVILSILNKHPELKESLSDEIISEIENYERRYHFEYENPKVFSMSDTWQ